MEYDIADNFKRMALGITVSIWTFFSMVIGLGIFYKDYSNFAETYNHNMYLQTPGWSPTNAMIGHVAFAFLALALSAFLLLGIALLLENVDASLYLFSIGFILYGLYELVLSVALNSVNLVGKPIYMLEGILFLILGGFAFFVSKKRDSDKVYLLSIVGVVIAFVVVWFIGYSNVVPTKVSAYDQFWEFTVGSIWYSSQKLPLAIFGGPTLLASLFLLLIAFVFAHKEESFLDNGYSVALSGLGALSGLLGYYLSIVGNYGSTFIAIKKVLHVDMALESSFPIFLGISIFAMLVCAFIVFVLEFGGVFVGAVGGPPGPEEALGVVVKEKKKGKKEEAVEEDIGEIDIEDLDLEL
ncbi:MAG: hypothetical protein ACP6IP_02585 [Candidatus Njordarchaeia archaeon]